MRLDVAALHPIGLDLISSVSGSFAAGQGL
jgi:hypothetical protein